jgi:hypothetical protein
MIKFDDLHKSISKKIYVPFVGDIMVTRWAYEALSVEQFKSNKFEKPFFKLDMEKSQNDWYASFLLPSLKVTVDECLTAGKNPDYREDSESNFEKINYHINDLSTLSGIKPGKWISSLNYQGFNEFVAYEAKLFLDSLRTSFRLKSRRISYTHDSLYKEIAGKKGEEEFIKIRGKDYNINLAEILLNNLTPGKIYDAGDKFIQKADPVFMRPGSKSGRAHFYAPYKQIGDLKIGTLMFNIVTIWLMSFIMFVTLYYNILKRFIVFLESLKLPILRKFGRDLLQF